MNNNIVDENYLFKNDVIEDFSILNEYVMPDDDDVDDYQARSTAYSGNDGFIYTILSHNVRAGIDTILEGFGRELFSDTSQSIYRGQDYYGLEANHTYDMPDGSEENAYKTYDFDQGTNTGVNNIVSAIRGHWCINIDESLDLFGDMNQTGIMTCTSLNTKVRIFTLWLLSYDNSRSAAKNARNHFHEELRSRCKSGLCMKHHVDKFKYSLNDNPYEKVVMNTQYNSGYYKNRPNANRAGGSNYDTNRIPEALSNPSSLNAFTLMLARIGSPSVGGWVVHDGGWVPDYFTDMSCLGKGNADELNLFKNAPPDDVSTNISINSRVGNDKYYTEYKNLVNWYIDFSKSGITLKMMNSRHGLMVFYDSLNIGQANIVFYVDFYLIDADIGNSPCLYAVLHITPRQKYYRDNRYESIQTTTHESCICKITLDRYGNLVFSENIIFPSVVLKRTNIVLGCSSVPKENSLTAFKILLITIGRKILNREKKKLGIEFEALNLDSELEEGQNSVIETTIINELDRLYDDLFDYIPGTTSPNLNCPGATPGATPGTTTGAFPGATTGASPVPEDSEEDSDNSIPGLINRFLYISCNGKTLSDPKEEGKYNNYTSIITDDNRINLVQTIFEQIKNEEKETVDFCRQTGLGESTPNHHLKNTALWHNMIFTGSSMQIPIISDQYSEEDFSLKSINSTCLDNKDDTTYLTSQPLNSDPKPCDESNFENNEDILGKCNLENKTILTEVCKSYATPIGNVGYPYKCTISDLNNLVETCEDFQLDCSNPEPGCNFFHPSNNIDMKTYPSGYPSENGPVIPIGGICSNHDIIRRNMDMIAEQDRINNEIYKRAVENRDGFLEMADGINASHAALSSSHESTLNAIEERSEETTRRRICNAKKRKYDSVNKICTNEFLELSMDNSNPEWKSCEEDRINYEETTKLRILVYMVVFLIIFFICAYFIFLR